MAWKNHGFASVKSAVKEPANSCSTTRAASREFGSNTRTALCEPSKVDSVAS